MRSGTTSTRKRGERLAAVTMRTLALCTALSGIGCAGYSERTLEARQALDAGAPKRALALYNEELDVETGSQLPEDVSGENALLILDRSTILQQLEDYEHSSRDLQTADKQVEMLDFSRTAVDDIGKYVFSDDTGPYKAPPYEKLMINTMNMVNYLARGDLQGARVEARRLTVMQKYLRDHEDPATAMMAPGSYLAGFVFEKSRRPDEALRFYDEALAYGTFPSLREPVRRLQKKSGYSSPRLQKLLAGETDGTETEAPSATPDASASYDESEFGELLVIVNYGRVPAKIAERVPIGLALTYAAVYMTPAQTAQTNHLAAQGLVTWVNYPALEKKRPPRGTPSAAVDGEWIQLEQALAVDSEARKAHEEAKGAIMAAAITRMIARIAAGEGARAASGSNDALGILLSLGTQAALTAADTPDTRSWATLPARITLGRVRVPAGKHQVVLEAQGEKRTEEVVVEPGGWGVVVLTVLR